MVPKHPVTPCQLLHRTVRLLISDFVDPQSSEITLLGLHLLTFFLGDKVTWSWRSFPATRVTRSKACNEHVTQRCSVKQALRQNVFFFFSQQSRQYNVTAFLVMRNVIPRNVLFLVLLRGNKMAKDVEWKISQASDIWVGCLTCWTWIHCSGMFYIFFFFSRGIQAPRIWSNAD